MPGGAYFGQVYGGDEFQSFTTPSGPTATSDVIVNCFADDIVVQLFADDLLVRCVADDVVAQVVADDRLVRVPADDGVTIT